MARTISPRPVISRLIIGPTRHLARPGLRPGNLDATLTQLAAQAEIRSSTGQRQLTRDDIAAIVAALGDPEGIICDADPADKAELYTNLGLRMTYRPQKRLVEATVTPNPTWAKGLCPGEPNQLHIDWPSMLVVTGTWVPHPASSAGTRRRTGVLRLR
jgi:hypothetical protein